ncbi:hypothetical protein V5O48_002227 [Marasmius crinis-equi]|uniref:Nucleolar 27S pre-rRNA processing Urb2/Npa2 C-terminal domain-containing protein n=1 Tax=Marasmius crinis-equi TaxID=585013 RepID=A0ABR3FXG5_9AGAR
MSSQLIRALKTHPDDPQNIQRASQAWQDTALYAPRKGEIIAEWILTRFQKGQALFDPQYWTLLHDVVSHSDSEPWIGPLLGRVTIAPVVVAYLKGHDCSQTAFLFRKSIEIIWPRAVQKITIEHLLECFGALLSFLRNGGSDEHILVAGQYILTSYGRSLLVTALKKKICTLFIQEHLSSWTEVVSEKSNTMVRSAGLESLFNLDVLRDSKMEQLLFDHLAMLPSETVVPTLPILFTAYIQTGRKYRGALFGQSANRDSTPDFCAAGFRFLSSCQTILSRSNSPVAVWTCRASLLDIVDRENLLSGGSAPEHSAILRSVVNSALAELIPSEKGPDTSLVHSTIQSLAAITRIDYMFIGPFLSDIISRLLLLPATTSSALSLMELILEYHVKTRTIDDYIKALFKGVGSDPEHHSTEASGIRRLHDMALRSPVLHPTHLSSLSKKVHDHLTPNQTIEVAQLIKDSIEELWNNYRSERRGKGEKKRRKLDDEGGLKPSRELMGSHLSVSGRVAVPILASFSMDSLPKQLREEFVSVLKSFSSDVLSTVLSRSMKAVRSASKEGEDGTGWSDEVIAVATLQLQYALGLHKNLSHEDNISPDKLVPLFNSKEHLPELKLELLRRLFRDSATSTSFGLDENILAPMLELLKETSTSSDLNQLALLHMLIQRWLPVLNDLASEEHLEAFISILLVARFTSDTKGDKATMILVSQCFASAEFWELANMRRIFLALIDKRTILLNDLKAKHTLKEDVHAQLMTVFDALLLVPIEYLTRHMKVELMRRALCLDTTLCSQKNLPQTTIHRSLCTLRILVNRLLADLGPYDQPGILQALQHLQKTDTTTSIPEGLLSATLSLGETCMITLLKNSNRNPVDTESLISSYSVDLLEDSFRIRSSCFERFVVILDAYHNVKDFPQETVIAIETLFNYQRESLTSRLRVSSNELVGQLALLKSWRHVLMLGRWLGVKERDVPLVSPPLCTALASNLVPTGSHAPWRELYGTVFALCVEEARWCLDDRRLGHLELILALYLTLCRKTECSLPAEDRVSVIRELEGGLTVLLSDSTVEAYQHALDLVAATLIRSAEEDLHFTVNLAAVLLRDPPKGTLSPAQTFTTGCINAFNSRDVFIQGVSLVRLGVLRFISQRCRDRPAALRPIDLGGIWSLLAKMLFKSEAHDSETNTEIFTEILSICTALVRLRRDLVVLTLPHLAVVLQLLLMTMRSPRPNLGGKQTGVVSGSFPKWMNIRQPLAVEEAKALARLLESLSTKTLVKVHTSSNEPQKAESLAKPFSKHAAHVLRAYVQASNDPLCVLPAAVRKALQPGLFSLCSITNDYSRDALMASMGDAGEKLILKGLWKEYEKQRYVGKG